MFTFYIENHEPFGPLTKNCPKLDKNKSIVFRFSVFVVYTSAVGDCTLFIEGTGLEIFTKSSLKKSLPCPKNMTKKPLPLMQLLQKKFVPHMLKKFIYLSGKVLLLFETLNFQNQINSKRYTSLNEQPY